LHGNSAPIPSKLARDEEGGEKAMSPFKKKKRKLGVSKEAKRRARDEVGLPPPEKVIIERKFKPPKHKKKIIEEEFL